MSAFEREWCENRIAISNTLVGGIYEISRPGIWTYVGAIERLSDVQDKYAINVKNLRAGGDWHNQQGERFRSIHHKIAEAYAEGVPVIIEMLAVEDDKRQRNQLKREFVATRRLAQAHGGARLLNGESRPPHKNLGA